MDQSQTELNRVLDHMWPRLVGLAVVEAGLVWWLTRPLHAIPVDPNNPDTPFQPDLLQFTGYVAMIGVIVIPWLAYRVISRASQSEDNPLE